MAKQTMKSGLVSKLGAKLSKAVETHKGDETKFSGGAELPAGIENGIAKLVLCKFGTYEKGDNKGEFYFMAQGVIVAPSKHEGIPIVGLRTQLGPEAICETPKASRKTVDEHVAWVLNEMRKLGVDTSELGADDLESTAEALQSSDVHFRFRTWQGEATKEYPNPRVNHQWGGAVDYAPDEDSDSDDVVDDTEEASDEVEEVEEESSEETDFDALGEAADGDDEEAQATLTSLAEAAGLDPTDAESYPDWATLAATLKEGVGEEEAEEEEEEEEEEVEEEAEAEEEAEEEESGEASLEDLAAEADKDPQGEAAATLNEKALEAGIDQETIDGTSSWAEVAEMITSAGSIDYAALGTAADEDDEDAQAQLKALAEELGLDPDDAETYPDWATLATAIESNNGEEAEAEEEEAEEEEEFIPEKGGVYHYKPAGSKKAVEVEVTVVGKTKVTIKSHDNGKIYKDVPFEQLSVE